MAGRSRCLRWERWAWGWFGVAAGAIEEDDVDSTIPGAALFRRVRQAAGWNSA